MDIISRANQAVSAWLFNNDCYQYFFTNFRIGSCVYPSPSKDAKPKGKQNLCKLVPKQFRCQVFTTMAPHANLEGVEL